MNANGLLEDLHRVGGLEAATTSTAEASTWTRRECKCRPARETARRESCERIAAGPSTRRWTASSLQAFFAELIVDSALLFVAQNFEGL